MASTAAAHRILCHSQSRLIHFQHRFFFGNVIGVAFAQSNDLSQNGGVKAATLGILDIEDDLEKMAADTAGEVAGNLVDAFQKEKQVLEKFRGEVEKAIKQFKAAGKKETLVFFVDELDRCRPTFAIEMLERIKHLFDVPNIVFVLSVDKSQLEASTAAVYGEKINAPEYLRRFIDLEYGIPMVQSKKFTKTLLTRFELDAEFSKRNGQQTRYDKDNFVDTFTELADVHDMSLRARERFHPPLSCSGRCGSRSSRRA